VLARLAFNANSPDALNRLAGVTWTRVAFRRL